VTTRCSPPYPRRSRRSSGTRKPCAGCRPTPSGWPRHRRVRIGRNVYATQFHPELDVAGLSLRIEAYRYAGYFEPEQMDALLATARSGVVVEPPKLLQRFVELYARA
jgi:hypothetical protein